MSKHLGLHWRCVNHSSSWCTKAGVLRLAGIDVRRTAPQVCKCCCWCCWCCGRGGDDDDSNGGDCCECTQWPVDDVEDRLERRRVGPTVLGFGGGDSRLLLDAGNGADDVVTVAVAGGGVVDEAHEDADSFSLIIDSVSSIETDGNLFAANVVFFLRNNQLGLRILEDDGEMVALVRRGSSAELTALSNSE